MKLLFILLTLISFGCVDEKATAHKLVPESLSDVDSLPELGEGEGEGETSSEGEGEDIVGENTEVVDETDSDSDSDLCEEREFNEHPHEDNEDHPYHHREKCGDR